MMRTIISRFSALAVATAIALTAMPVSAQLQSEVKFEKGNDNAAVEGVITGREYRDYVLGARSGQTISVSLITDGTAYFNILPPGSDGVAIYNGSMDGENASIQLPANGDYTIRVYLMGDARDSGKTEPFMVSVAIM
jgi:hypothetical protein